MDAFAFPVQIFAAVCTLVTLGVGARLLHLMFEPDLVTPERLGATRRTYVMLVIGNSFISGATEFLSASFSDVRAVYLALLLLPPLFAIWNTKIAPPGHESDGGSILLVFLSAVALLGAGIVGFTRV